MTGSHFKRIGVSALTVAALSLTACGSAASSGGAASGGGSSSGASGSQALTIGYDSDPAPQGYDPLLYGAGQRLFYESLYQSLFVATANGGAAPQLVSSYSYNAGKTQMTLKLKSGVTFSDGSKLTAQLVKENLDRRSNVKLHSYGAFAKGGAEEITSVAAPDASTVVLTFAAPQATFQTELAGESGMIVGQKGISDPSSLQTTPDGSGPYTLASAVAGSSYTVTRKPGTAPAYAYSKITYKPYLDKTARVNAQISGQTDVSVLDATTAATAQASRRVAREERRHDPDAADVRQDGRHLEAVRQHAGTACAELRHQPGGVRGRPRQGQPADGERVPGGLGRLRPVAQRQLRLQRRQGQAAARARVAIPTASRSPSPRARPTRRSLSSSSSSSPRSASR